MIGKFGETVSFTFLGGGAAPNNSTTGTAYAVYLQEPSGTARPLQSYEKFWLDSVVANVPSGVTAVDILNANTGGTAQVPTSATLVVSLSATAPEFHDDGEGIQFPLGVTPFVLLTGSTGTTVRVGGVGRIVQYTQIGRQNWQASLNGGTVAGGAS